MGMMKIIGNVGRKFRTAAMKKVRPKQFSKQADEVVESIKPSRVSFKGNDMQERNFMKSYKTVGGYKYGTIVSKEAARTQGVRKAVRDASAFEGGTKRNWAKNYKTRSYQP